jgi:tetratricopeptide (TPR) repeat protein
LLPSSGFFAQSRGLRIARPFGRIGAVDLKAWVKKSAGQGIAVILLIAGFFLLYPEFLRAQEGSGRYIDEALQMDLADHFFSERDYDGAVREYKRFLFFFPQSAKAGEALLKIARSYLRGQKWEEALSACESLIQKSPAPPLKAEAFLVQGDVLAVKRQYSEARISFQKAREASPGTRAADEAQIQIARTYLREEKWKEAADEFRKVDRNSKLYPTSDSFAQGLDRIQEVPQKSPAAAGVLSAILPGAGQAYSEEYGRAAVSFLLNGLFIWGMVESFRHDHYVVGGILTLFEVGWYSANILNAVNSAEKYNRKKTKEYINGLESESGISLGLSLRGKTPALAFRYVF